MADNDELKEFQSQLRDEPAPKSSNKRAGIAQECPTPTTSEPASATASDHVQWGILGNSTYTAVGETLNTLPTGVYTVEIDGRTGQFLFVSKTIITDELTVLPDSASSKVLTAVDTFWNAQSKFQEFGQLYKRGILMWGPAGSGKTSTLMLLMKDLLERRGIVILAYGPPSRASRGLEILRRVEPERRLICVLEDIDEIVAEYGEHELLALLDGEAQISNVCFVATTNYPERLDKRLINRPSRFDEIIKVGMPSAAARATYLGARLGSNFQDMQRWVEETKGFSVAHLRELVVAVFCLDRQYEETIDRLRQMVHTPKSEGGSGAGFTVNHSQD